MLGNSLGLENTRFIAWNRLAGGEVRVRAIEDTDSAGVFCGNLPERWTGGEGRECQQSGENPGICGERKLEAGGSAGTFVL